MAKKNSKNLFETALVEKRNILNEIRNNNMTLQELRFFSIYLSKINARDNSVRVVKFPINDFQRIMSMQIMNLTQIRENFTHILQQVVSVPNENGRGFTSFQLFKRCKLLQDETGEWFVEIEAHDDALPLMFDFKRNYFTYELWNALRLKSTNQIRMYEILKQYEMIGTRELSVTELRALLGIAPNEYPRWDRFRVRVLDSCQQALKDYTDICFTYEKGRSGRGGTWLTIVFHIYKNTEYVDQLTLSEFIDLQATGSDNDDITDNIQEFSSETESELKIIGKFSRSAVDKASDDVPVSSQMVKSTIVSEEVTEESPSLIDQITAEVDEHIDYEGMKMLTKATGGDYEDTKLDLLDTIRNIIVQVIAGYVPVRVNKQIIPTDYAREVFSKIDFIDVSNVICKYLEYPREVAMPKVLLTTMLFNEVNSKGTESVGMVTMKNEAKKMLFDN